MAVSENTHELDDTPSVNTEISGVGIATFKSYGPAAYLQYHNSVDFYVTVMIDKKDRNLTVIAGTIMRKRSSIRIVAATILFLCAAGCGGRLANTGFARVTEVSPQGAIRVQYDNGELAWKKVDPDNARKDTLIAMKNRLKPAKYLETKNGSTLTFLDGETIVYKNLY